MAISKKNGEIIPFIKQKNYIMVNNDLGKGSFGKTVLLQDPFIDELFVAKKYEPEEESIKQQFYRNFLAEIKILYKLNHKNIVRIYNYYAYENLYTGYILMEYIDGKTIGEFIESYCAPFSHITLDDIFLQLVDAFCYMEAHEVIHRDIREGNILIERDGTVKVIDFGIGKITAEAMGNNTDSLVAEINRATSDTLPEEYFKGTYSSLTDMFYLAELFERLIDNALFCDRNDFSYNDITHKMKEKNPQNRFASFAEIRDSIGKRNFLQMEISDFDRQIYQIFTNLVHDSLLAYTSEPRFNMDSASFISRLKKAITTNAFENIIQNNADVISCIVDCGYRYSTSLDIPVQSVKDFLDWFQNSTQQSQELILNNFVSKILNIKVEELEDEIPF